MHGDLPTDQNVRQQLLRFSSWFTMVRGILYPWGFPTPMLNCLDPDRALYILREVHEGSCGHYLIASSLAKKVLGEIYYWPTMEKDASDLTKKCFPYQMFTYLHNAPLEELTTTLTLWPFCRWGMDILDPFPSTRAAKVLNNGGGLFHQVDRGRSLVYHHLC
ncbi:PREDICTED: uncharacterized protein LOC109327692 [Lupinus angustifolius]|uniref:uncharacterized protein LOC109327692 n=1 Tax=Lupinus angustifolius TaxID=3871 RepID=UPI00092E8355|nr:PREDICTED: uncharacterized protein LOC109327692 [Lupinus angustifolius]